MGGIPEVDKNNDTGILIDPRHCRSNGWRFVNLLESFSMRNGVGNQGRKIIEEEFEWKTIRQEFFGENSVKNRYQELNDKLWEQSQLSRSSKESSRGIA